MNSCVVVVDAKHAVSVCGAGAEMSDSGRFRPVADNALSLSLSLRTPPACALCDTRGTTYFSGALVFDAQLALPLAVIDVTQLVVEQVRRRRRESGEKHRGEGREGAHSAAEPQHLEAGKGGSGESVELRAAPGSLCGGAAAAAASARVLSAAALLLVASHASSSSPPRTSCPPPSPQTHNLQSCLHCSAQCGRVDIHKKKRPSCGWQMLCRLDRWTVC